jgi:hypothetical protein
MTRQTRGEVPFHIGPLSRKDAEHHGVTNRPIAPGIVMTEYAILVSAQSRNCPLGCKVEVVRPQPNYAATQRLESVREQQQFADGVNVTALPTCGIPGIADLNSINLCHYIVVSRTTDDCSRT